MNFYCLINLWENNITFASAYILFLDKSCRNKELEFN